ncbi:MAG: hypothetical protein AUI54_03000 [Acidobacteria bacterium 13_1_40CM_2_56_5]|nr:MAG: hypothetical protein AUI54_03000 [Acidobacteria bacterium 13_1_40CM_2_56_5]
MLVDINFWEIVSGALLSIFAGFVLILKLLYRTIGWKTLLALVAFVLLCKIVVAIRRSRRTIP